MSADPSAREPASIDADRLCVNCGKRVNPDRERLCNHCGLPFRIEVPGASRREEPAAAGPQLIKAFATLAVALPPLGPLLSLSGDPGTLLGFSIVAIANTAALVLAWRRPLPGGILLTLAGAVPFAVELVADAAGAADPASRHWLFWFFPGGLVGGALFVAAAFVQAPRRSEPGLDVEPAGAGGSGLGARVRREAIGLAALAAIGLVFFAVMALYPYEPGTSVLLPGAILLAGWPLLLVGAGVIGYRVDRTRGSFVAGLAAALVAVVGTGVATAIAGQPFLEVGEAEWIGEAYLAAGLAIVGGGFVGLLGGGVASLFAGPWQRRVHR